MQKLFGVFLKKNDFLISMVGVTVWGIIFVAITVGYSTINSKDKSLYDYIMAIFSFLSASGIFVAAIIYFHQRSDAQKEHKKMIEYYYGVIKKEKENLLKYYKKLILIKGRIEQKKYINFYIRSRKDSYTFIFYIKGREKPKLYTFFINNHMISIINSICSESIKLDIRLYSPLKALVDETIKLDRRLHALFINYETSQPKKTKIIDSKTRKILTYELFTGIKNRIEGIEGINNTISNQ
ncbi:hypothetical protein I4902_12480 [Proteus alimentorum]|uniref:Uncharacterized protein n=2 Tax=Proteus alimentorum TaxID=1973495 RepID=A0ABS0IVV0_9GAMM|nr:hypothetical protein [Proteus alimentorum]MBG2880083.1 hypothetical protein [Proteus alimentorum]